VSRRWVVRDGDGATVGAVVARAAPGDATAIAEGRVFVGRKRAEDPEAPVAIGDEVTIAPPTAAGADVAILARGRGWVAVDKPAGLPTIPDHAGAAHSLLALAARAVGVPVVRLHATSRLDRDVSGVVVFATDRAAADRLKQARDAGDYTRRYVAIAARPPAAAAGTWDAPIGRAKDPRHRAVNGKEATSAITRFAVVAGASSGACVLALGPVTGRTHQLRVHASHAGAPLLGDRVYGGPGRLTLPSGKILGLDRVALHAARVAIPGHAPIVSPVPEAMRATWLALGGDGEAWDKAVSCPLDVA
jgi:23S rRNA-/tRNA-specific pseudouridylate synthase